MHHINLDQLDWEATISALELEYQVVQLSYEKVSFFFFSAPRFRMMGQCHIQFLPSTKATNPLTKQPHQIDPLMIREK